MTDRDRIESPPSANIPAAYRPQSEDTSVAADRWMFDQLRELDSLQTVARIGAANRMMNRLLLAGLQREHPAADDEELELRAAALKYGAEIVERVTGRFISRT